MKIVFCTNYFDPSIGGSEIVSRNIVDEFNKNHDVYVFTRSIPDRKIHGYKEKIVEYDKINEEVFISKIKTLKPDMIFVYSDVFDFFRSLLVSNLSIPLIVAPCGSNWAFSGDFKKRIFETNVNKVSKFICHSRHERDFSLLESLGVINKTHIIPNGVLFSEFEKNDLNRQDLISDLSKQNKKWIVNVANFFPEKGHTQMIEIIKRLSKKIDNIHFIQIATRDCPGLGRQLRQDWIKQATSELNNISFSLIDTTDRSKIIGIIKQSDVLVCSSLKEVAPIVHLESMACGTPWVSTSVGNVKDLSGGIIIESTKNKNFRYIFDECVFDNFTESIISSISKGRRDDGKKQIEKIFDWSKILPLYSEIISNG